MPINKVVSEAKKKVPVDQALMLISFVVDAAGMVIAIIFYPRLQPQIPIFYTLAEQTDQLANKEWIFLLPVLGLAMAVAHSLITAFNRRYDEFLWRLFALVTLIAELMLLTINIRIIWLIV